MKKFVNDINESGDGEVRSEKTMLYLNSKIINVFCNGIDNETYLEMVELMVNAINTFPSHGSGCTVERIEKMSVSFAAFSPIQAVSYIHLPNSLKPVKQTFTKKNKEWSEMFSILFRGCVPWSKFRDNGWTLPCCRTLAASKPTKELQTIPRSRCKNWRMIWDAKRIAWYWQIWTAKQLSSQRTQVSIEFFYQIITCLINGKHVMFFQEKPKKAKNLFSLGTKKVNCCLWGCPADTQVNCV